MVQLLRFVKPNCWFPKDGEIVFLDWVVEGDIEADHLIDYQTKSNTLGDYPLTTGKL